MVFTRVTKFLFRAWFSTWLVVGMIVDWTSCVVVYRIGGGDLKMKQTRCAVITRFVFKWFIIKTCPWIRISTPPMDDMVRLMDQDKVLLLLNHTSFFDTILLVGTIPTKAIGRYRTLMKRSLLDVPLFGDLIRMVGHFPVYFQSTDQHVFTVDKEKQEKVMEKVKGVLNVDTLKVINLRMHNAARLEEGGRGKAPRPGADSRNAQHAQVQAHVATNGCLCIFPEGKLNRTPETLCSFRKGIFSLAEEQQMAVVTLSSVGNNISWPIKDFVGGLPSKITTKISEVTEAGHGMSAESIREKAHETMQADVTYLFAERGASKPKQT